MDEDEIYDEQRSGLRMESNMVICESGADL
jgi:hypothetical protein